MSEELSKLQLIGKIAEANNKNLELIEELNDREDEIEQLRLELSGYRQAILQDKEMLGLKQEIEKLKEDNKELGRLYSSANNGFLKLHSIIKEVKEYIENVETLATIDKVNIFSISTLKSILDKGE